ncbi:hypothetical protein N7463_010955 [Penicillium fimorum]|uniref:Uncharacterized protein n=1 Tax=Penicillium fimorum TaxID=1882269 RepID=A0A9W9XKX2_9EURO|nr:hypothetical protein N7463_010955 [Penicillium fimorum]
MAGRDGDLAVRPQNLTWGKLTSPNRETCSHQPGRTLGRLTRRRILLRTDIRGQVSPRGDAQAFLLRYGHRPQGYADGQSSYTHTVLPGAVRASYRA